MTLTRRTLTFGRSSRAAAATSRVSSHGWTTTAVAAACRRSTRTKNSRPRSARRTATRTAVPGTCHRCLWTISNTVIFTVVNAVNIRAIDNNYKMLYSSRTELRRVSRHMEFKNMYTLRYDHDVMEVLVVM